MTFVLWYLLHQIIYVRANLGSMYSLILSFRDVAATLIKRRVMKMHPIYKPHVTCTCIFYPTENGCLTLYEFICHVCVHAMVFVFVPILHACTCIL